MWTGLILEDVYIRRSLASRNTGRTSSTREMHRKEVIEEILVWIVTKSTSEGGVL